MDTIKYKYDVAFSFLAQDEALATRLNDLLRDRLQTFLYSEKQREIAGTDGEKSFNTIFGKEACLVVVFYRSGWGQTRWTRIEELAIRNRAFDHGYDFVTFISLDESQTMPAWLPKTRLWVGLKRWGEQAAASVIEARLQELGGEPHEETVVERAARLERSRKFADRKKQFLGSEEGVNAANEEFVTLRAEIEQLIALVASSIALRLKSAQREIGICGPGPGLRICWCSHWSNNLDDARLDIELWKGPPYLTGEAFPLGFQGQKVMHFTFGLLPDEQRCWISSGPTSREYSTKELASFILKYYMDQLDATDTPKGKVGTARLLGV